MLELIKLYWIFAKIGAFTFGGGYAMLPIIQAEIVDRRGWCTDEEITDYYAIGQCTPGIIAINTATFVGQKRRGILGGIAATLGFATPSIIIISIIAALISNFSELPLVQNAFAGIRVCVCALILNAIVKLWKKSIVDAAAYFIFIVVLILSLVMSISPMILVILAGCFGIVIQSVKAKFFAGKRERK